MTRSAGRWTCAVALLVLACEPDPEGQDGGPDASVVDAAQVTDGAARDAGTLPDGAALPDAGQDGGRPSLPPVLPEADVTFGSGGAAIVGIEGTEDVAPLQVLAMPDGRILAAGAARESVALARVLADGTLDASFGDGGVTYLPIARPAGAQVGGCPNCSLHLALDGAERVLVATSFAGTWEREHPLIARVLADGALDATFGDGGVATGFDERLPGRTHVLGGIAVDGAGRVLVALANRVTRLAVDGSLDASFGDGGTFESSLGGRFASFQAMTVQPDGRIVVTGRRDVDVSSQSRVFVARLTADGALDPSFGDAGVTLDSETGGCSFSCSVRVGRVVLQDDGRIVVAAERPDSGLSVGRFTTAGDPDPSFGTDGWALAGEDNPHWVSVSAQGDGSLVAFGVRGLPVPCCTRLTPAGVLDTAFGESGLGQLPAVVNLGLRAGTVLPDDRIVTAGLSAHAETRALLFAARADGQVDDGFGDGGLRDLPWRGGQLARSRAAAVQSDGRVLLGANARLARLTADGQLDPTFGTDGGLVEAPGDVLSIATDGSGDIYAVWWVRSPSEWGVTRYRPDGSIDGTFDGTAAPGGAFVGGGATNAPDGAVYLAGQLTLDASGEVGLGVLRLLDDGSPDPAFGDAGVVFLPTPTGVTRVLLAPEPTGGVFVYGPGGLGGPGSLRRLSSDGNIDPAFGPDGVATSYEPTDMAVEATGAVVLVDIGRPSAGERTLELERIRPDGTFDDAFEVSEPLGFTFDASLVFGAGIVARSDGTLRIALPIGREDERQLRAAILQYTADGTPDASFGDDGRALIGLPGESAFYGAASAGDGSLILVGRAWSDETHASGMLAVRLDD